MRQKGGVPGPPTRNPRPVVPDTVVAQAAYAETLLPGSAQARNVSRYCRGGGVDFTSFSLSLSLHLS